MPIINPTRQGLQLPQASINIGDANFMVGAASPKLEQAEVKPNIGEAAVTGFLSGAVPAFQAQLKKQQSKAAIIGALDANSADNPFLEMDENTKKVNFLLEDAYKEGYVSAGLRQKVAEHRAGALERANSAALAGLSREEYLSQERKAGTQFASEIADYLQFMDEQTAGTILGGLAETSQGALNQYQKTATGVATAEADRALTNGLTMHTEEFQLHLRGGDYRQAGIALSNGLNDILTSNFMSKEDKVKKAVEFAQFTASQTDSPEIVDFVEQVFVDNMGMMSLPVIKALRTEVTQAATKQAGFWVPEMYKQGRDLESYMGADYDTRRDQYVSNLESLVRSRVISPEQAVSYLKSVDSARDKDAPRRTINFGVDNGSPTETIAAAAGMDLDKARRELLKGFPDTAQGNAALLAYGQKSKDTWATSQALGRMADNLSELYSTMGVIAAKDGVVSQEMENKFNSFASVWDGLGHVDQSMLLDNIKDDEARAVTALALAKGGTNQSGVLFDTIKSIQDNRTNKRYTNPPIKPSDEVLDVGMKLFSGQTGEANWFSFGAESDAQKALTQQAMREDYQQLWVENQELLRYKSDSDINALLRTRAAARRIEVDLGKNGGTIYAFLPVGESVGKLAQQAGVPQEFYQESLAQAANTAVKDMIPKSAKDFRVEIRGGSRGAWSDDFEIAVIPLDPDFTGSPTTMTIPQQNIIEVAKLNYEETNSNRIKDGKAMVGARSVDFLVHHKDRRKTKGTAVLDGTNSVGADAGMFSSILEHMTEFEGFKPTKSVTDGVLSVGFGRAETSKKHIPDSVTVEQGVKMLKEDVEDHYENAKKLAAKRGVDFEDQRVATVLTDLSYHGWIRSADPVAKALAEMDVADNTSVDKVFTALQGTPAYKRSNTDRQAALTNMLTSYITQKRVQSYVDK